MSGLQGLHRWVTAPAAVSGLLGASVAVLYAFFTVAFPAGTLPALLISIAVCVALALFAGDRQQQASLPTLKRLGTGAVAPHKEHLTEAVRELARLPDLTFWVTLGCWVAGAVGIALGYSQTTQAGWELAARLAFLGIALGPLVATLGYLQVVTRTRAAIERVAAAGLAPREVIAAIPPVRLQLQQRLMLYAAVAVGTPLLLVTDLAVRRTEQVFARVLAQPTAATQSATLAAELGAGGGWGLVLVGAAVLGVVVICGYLCGSVLGAPMRALANKTRAIASGKLGGGGLVPSEDELWAAAAGFTSLETQLVGVVTQLQDAGLKIQRTTDELVSSRAKHDRGAGDQTAALAQTSATTEELARSAKQISSNATHVATLASQTLDAARTGKNNADQFYVSILKVREGNQAIADSVVKLNKRVQQVGRIVEFIDGIADKSDLLALNAELEGNKAGEVGRGFSLVAAEMRRLSESVMGSTREIIGLIHEVRDATNAAVMATEAGVKASDMGSALARKVSEGLSDILTYATTTADAVQRITLATHQQEVGTDQLAQAMNDILQSTRAGEGASKKMSTANAQLQALATELKATVGRFEVS